MAVSGPQLHDTNWNRRVKSGGKNFGVLHVVKPRERLRLLNEREGMPGSSPVI